MINQTYSVGGRYKFKMDENSTNCEASEVKVRKMNEDEMKKYGVTKEQIEENLKAIEERKNKYNKKSNSN